jgi:hypothetical protein
MSESNVIELRETADKARDLENGIVLIGKWRRILAVRWLTFIALIGGVLEWIIAIANADMWHVIAAAGYSAGVLIPTLGLYFLTHKAD